MVERGERELTSEGWGEGVKKVHGMGRIREVWMTLKICTKENSELRRIKLTLAAVLDFVFILEVTLKSLLMIKGDFCSIYAAYTSCSLVLSFRCVQLLCSTFIRYVQDIEDEKPIILLRFGLYHTARSRSVPAAALGSLAILLTND